MTQWKEICRVEDIPVLGARRVSRDTGLDVAVFRNDQGEVFALLDRCPHKGGPLSQGIVFGTSVACPADQFKPIIAICRPAAGACDLVDYCTGASPACPPDDFVPAGTVCRAAVSSCDQDEICSGTRAACPADQLTPDGTTCPGGTCKAGMCI